MCQVLQAQNDGSPRLLNYSAVSLCTQLTSWNHEPVRDHRRETEPSQQSHQHVCQGALLGTRQGLWNINVKTSNKLMPRRQCCSLVAVVQTVCVCVSELSEAQALLASSSSHSLSVCTQIRHPEDGSSSCRQAWRPTPLTWRDLSSFLFDSLQDTGITKKQTAMKRDLRISVFRDRVSVQPNCSGTTCVDEAGWPQTHALTCPLRALPCLAFETKNL